MNYHKRSSWNKNQTLYRRIGFILSLAFIFCAFQWEHKTYAPLPNKGPIFDNPILEIIPRTDFTIHKPKYVPPVQVSQKKASVFTIIEDTEFPFEPDDFLTEDPVDDIDWSPVSNPVREAPQVVIKQEEPVDDFIYITPDMPILKSCYDPNISREQRKECSDMSLIKFIQSSIRYPQIAIANNIQGKVIASFMITKEGKMENIEILRGIGGTCDEEVIRILKTVPEWLPGKQHAKPVNVIMRVPVNFTIGN